jgi:NADH-quinone oxidoreductase subunit L
MGVLGGLAPKMPWTSKAFFIGSMAMAGVVPLSGFFAKDEILVAAKDFSTPVLILILATLPLTALYMIRLYILTFMGQPKDHHVNEHAHEMGPVMTLPVVSLAAITLVAGFVSFEGVGKALGLGSGFLGFIEYVLEEHPHAFEFDVPMAIISSLLVVAGLVGGVYAFSGEAVPAKAAGAKYPFLYNLFSHKFYIDDFYQWCINNLVLGLARVVAYFDRNVVNDTGINGPGEATGAIAWVLKFTQTGKAPNYALAMIVGVVVLAIIGFSVKG